MGEGEPRTIAIMRLAMAGNLDTFRLLLGNADPDGLFIFASRYLNRDGTVCVDPELERAIVEGLRDPDLGRSLVGLLGWNTYRDMRTLQALREVPFEPIPSRADKYTAFGRAITSTHLLGVEADVLAHARNFMPLDTPLKKRVLTSLHQHYVDFFTRRRYAPSRLGISVSCFNKPIETNRSRASRSATACLRTVIQRGLAAIGGADAHELLIGELNEVADNPLDPFAASELQNLSKLLLSATQPG